MRFTQTDHDERRDPEDVIYGDYLPDCNGDGISLSWWAMLKPSFCKD